MELPNVWIKYEGQIKIRDKLLGGIPRHPDQMQGWIEAKGLQHKEEEIKESIDVVEELEKHWCGFRRNSDGLYIRGAMIKQMIKVSAQRLGLYRKRRGSKDILHGAVFVKPENISLGKQQPDGFMEVGGSISSPQRGKVSILSRFDYVENVQPFDFELWVVESCPLTEDDLLKCFALAQESGLGAYRPQDYGKFDLLELKRIEA